MKRNSNSPRHERLDIRTVASRAKVSIATVSRTINGVASVDPVLSARVWKAIRELNYMPNTQARALVSGRSHLLGVIVSDITNPFFPELIQGFEDAAVEAGYEILIGSTNYDTRRVEACVRRFIQRKVDGVAIMTFGIEQPLLDQLAARDIPLVFVDVGTERPLTSTLKVDYARGIRQAVQHLAVLGHREFGFISGPRGLHSADERAKAFHQSVREIGVTPAPQWIIEGDHRMEGGRDAMIRLMQLDQLPTALLCSNDMTAIGVLHTALDRGLRIPDDLSIVGFDDVHLAEYIFPPLTTVQMSRRDLSRSAVQALHASLTTLRDSQEPQHYDITTQLIVRKSTSLPRSAPLSLRKLMKRSS